MTTPVTETSKRHLVELKKMLKNLKIMALESEMAGLDVFNEDIGENEQPRRNSRIDALQQQLEAEKQERELLQNELAKSHELVQIREKMINDKDQELQQTNVLISQTVDALVKEAVALKTVESAGKFWLGLVRDKKKDEDAAIKIQSLRRGQLARRREEKEEDEAMVAMRAKVAELSQLLNEERTCREALQQQVASLQAQSFTAPLASSVVMSKSYAPAPAIRITQPIASARLNEKSMATPRRNSTSCATKAAVPVQPMRLQAVERVTANKVCGAVMAPSRASGKCA
jgi:hypothetical protein